MSQQDIEEFYDGFSPTFLRDLAGGNPRVDAVHEFYRQAIHNEARSILVVGCGAGKDAHVLADVIAPRAKVVAVDISENNIRMAEALFRHPRVSFRKADATVDDLGGPFDYVVLPDVYEHIPIDRRILLHQRLGDCTAPDGQVLLSCPTIWHQASLRAAGSGLQVVDEDVSLSDVEALARDIGGFVSLFRMVSIWRANDYFHAVVDRREGTFDLPTNHRVLVRAQAPMPWPRRVWRQLLEASKFNSLVRRGRRRLHERKLARAGLRVDRNG